MPITHTTEADNEMLAKQMRVADELVEKFGSGNALNQSLGDLDEMQSVIDTAELGTDKSYELQCLAIAFGQVLASNEPGLNWAIIESKNGRDLAMRFEETRMCFPVRTLLSQRVQAGQEIDLKAIYAQLTDKLAEIKSGPPAR
ncbi:MAG: hypothetical protein ACI8QC_003024 [Planctomycetota bacterium]|jgi:hypothetical protein